MKLGIRIVLFSLAIIAVLVLFVGGGYLVWQQFSRGPAIEIGSLPMPEGAGLEKKVIGLYLQWKQADLERPLDGTASEVPFVVESGETAADIAQKLKDAGLISDPGLFRMLVRYYDLQTSLEAGEYELSASMSMLDIAEALQHGRLQEASVTIPEGWRLEEVASYLDQQGIAARSDFIAECTTGAFDFDFLSGRPAGASLEGYLFPDTYRFASDATVEDVVRLMLSTFDQRVTDEMRQQVSALGLSLHQIISLASIVEREAVIPEERPVIAAVYLNRIEQGMYLDADPTIQYAKGFSGDTGKWWNPLTAEDYQSVDSPYNSYTHLGFPPGPICNPGLDSIRAVLYPASVDYLYFLRNDVAGDGSHVFSRTFEEHLENQAKYRR